MLMRVAGHMCPAWERMLRVAGCVSVVAAALEGCMTLEQKPPPPVTAPAIALEAPPRQLAVPATVPKPVPRPSAKRARRPARPEHEARPERPPIDMKILIGMDQAGVRGVLGGPKRIEAGRLSLSWFYDAPGCSMQVIFYPSLDSGTFRALKFSSVDADGDPLDADDTCVSAILMARGNAH